MDTGSRHRELLRLGILILLSKTHVLKVSGTESSQPIQGRGMIRKQEESRGGVFLEANLAIMNAIIEPMDGEVETLGELWHGEEAPNMTRVRLMAGDKAAMLQPQPLHGAH